jgi:hypothetical protein
MDQVGIPRLIVKSFLFDTASAIELSKRVEPQWIWTLKLTSTSFYIGLLGGLQSIRKTNHQWIVENLHRLPVTKPGLYQYHKHRNLKIIRNVIESGVKSGIKYSFITFLYCGIEHAMIKLSGQEHFTNSTVAGFTTSLLVGNYYKLGKRVILLGTMAGLAVGLLQESYYQFNQISIKQFDIQKENFQSAVVSEDK